jgi:DHA2 family multidrug resistance protein
MGGSRDRRDANRTIPRSCAESRRSDFGRQAQVSLQPATRDRLAELQHYFMAQGYPDPAGVMHRAIIAVGQTIRAQATIMGYADSFALIGVVLLTAVLAVAMLRKGAAAGGAAH